MMPKTYYLVEDGQETTLEKFYDFPEAVQCAEQTGETKEIFAFKGNGDNHELIGYYRVRESEDNGGAPE